MRTGVRGTLRADHQVPDCRIGLPENERLTVMTGAVLLVLCTAECLIWPGVPWQKRHGAFGVKDLERRIPSCPRTWGGSGADG